MNESPLVILFAGPDLTLTRRLRAELRRRGARVLLGGSVEEVIHQAALSPPELFIMEEGVQPAGGPAPGNLCPNPSAHLVPRSVVNRLDQAMGWPA